MVVSKFTRIAVVACLGNVVTVALGGAARGHLERDPSSGHVVEEIAVRCEVYADRPAPKYRIAVKSYTDMSPQPWAWIQASIALRQFNREDLAALACRLSSDYAGEHAVLVKLFDSHRAAKVWVSAGDVDEARGWRPPRAEYGFHRDTSTNYLDWYLDDLDRTKIIRINLGAPPPLPAK